MIGKFKEIFAIDFRSLAAFRIGIAFVIIVDLIDRLRDLEAFYTDFGVMPREWVNQSFSLSWRFFSVHLLGGSFYFQAVLFSIALLAALALLVGYRTRLATLVSWVLVTSIFVRSPMIFYGADSLTRMLLFWAIFLPLGEYWSLDALRNKEGEKLPAKVFSAASFALLLQVLLLYWFSSILKSGIEWQNGTALYYALSDNVRGSTIGRYLLSFPPLIPILTYGVRWFELFGTVLLIVPFSLGLLRTLGVFLFALLQLGIFLGLNVGILPVVSFVASLVFLPPWFWDKFSQKRASRRVGAKPVVNIIVGTFIIFVIVINLGAVAPKLRKFENSFVSQFFHLHQRWGPFAPHPPLVNKWYEIPAQLSDGTETNLYETLPYTNKRWINFLELLNFDRFRYNPTYFGEYLCRSWNRENDVKLENLRVRVLTQKIPFGDERQEVRSSNTFVYICPD